jgi:hypothetical protein
MNEQRREDRAFPIPYSLFPVPYSLSFRHAPPPVPRLGRLLTLAQHVTYIESYAYVFALLTDR